MFPREDKRLDLGVESFGFLLGFFNAPDCEGGRSAINQIVPVLEVVEELKQLAEECCKVVESCGGLRLSNDDTTFD